MDYILYYNISENPWIVESFILETYSLEAIYIYDINENKEKYIYTLGNCRRIIKCFCGYILVDIKNHMYARW